MHDIASNIKKARKKKEMSQNQLAEAVHVTRQAVSNWETGKARPDVDCLESIADALGIDMMELLYGEERKKLNRKQKRIIVILGLMLLFLIIRIFIAPIFKEKSQLTYSMSQREIWFIMVYGLAMLIAVCTGWLFKELLDTGDSWSVKNVWKRRLLLAAAVIGLMPDLLMIVQTIAFYCNTEGPQPIFRLAGFIVTYRILRDIFLYVLPAFSGFIFGLLFKNGRKT